MIESKISKFIDGVLVEYNKRTDQILQEMIRADGDYNRAYVTAERDVCVEVTNKCNLFCGNCFSGNSNAEIEMDKAIKWLNNNRSKIIRIGLTGGEPFLHSKIREIIKEISAIENVGKVINSNGTLLRDGHFRL